MITCLGTITAIQSKECFMSEECNYETISKVSGRGVYVSRAMSKELGNFTTAGFMAQLIYVAEDLEKKVDEFFYKTIEEITNETGISKWEQETAKKLLVKKGWITITRKGIPPKNHFTITREFTMWNAGVKKQEKSSKGGKTSLQTPCEKMNECGTSFQREEKPSFEGSKNLPILHKQHTETTNKNKTSLSDCSQSDCVANDFTSDDFLKRWNELAKKYSYTSVRVVNSSLASAFEKVNKIIREEYLPDEKKPWDIYFKNVEAIMLEYLFFNFRKYFDPLYALRLTKQNDIIHKICNYNGLGWIPKDKKNEDIKTCRKLKDTIKEAIIGEKQTQNIHYTTIEELQADKKKKPELKIKKRMKKYSRLIDESRERVKDLVEKQNELDSILQKEDEA
jgi:hypothetical protein